MKQYKWIPENLKGILAFMVVFLSFTYYFVITIFMDKSIDQQVIIGIITANSTVLQYYFGSSQGSNKKDEIINQMKNDKNIE